MAQLKPKSVLFLCTGNYYRSRFAEILFNSVAQRMGLPWHATSSGLALERGANNFGPMAPSAIAALEKLGIRGVSGLTRMPIQVSVDDFERANHIVALHRVEHAPLIDERHPAWATKVEFWNVDDVADACGLIEREVMALVARLLGGGERADLPTIPESRPAKETPKKLTAKVGRETAGRRGKGVTTVFEVSIDDDALRELAAVLKQRCGTGGTVKDGRIEIQGDQRERIVAVLEGMGYRVKRAGD